MFPLVIVYGLLSAAIWGSGDFIGGFATKKNLVFTVTFVSQLFGTLVFVLLAFSTHETTPSGYYILMGCFAGVFGGVGVSLFYKALAEQKMGIVAPVSAVLMAVIPVCIGAVLEGLPTVIQILGIICVLIGIFAVSREEEIVVGLKELKLPVLSGVNFGLFITFVKLATEEQLYAPLIFARFVSMSVILIGGTYFGKRSFLKINSLALIIISGICDAGGNIFFALASRTGRLDIASVLSSLYPATTVILAAVILKERMNRIQIFGVIVSLIGIILLTL